LVGGAFTAVGVAITASIGTIIKSTADMGDKFRDMSLRTGESTKALSALSYAGELSGISIGSIESSMKKAQRAMADAATGTGTAKDAFAELGIQVTHTDGSLLTGTELMLAFADKTAGMGDASKKTALAMEIFGRSGTDLLPLFAEGSAGIKSMMEEAVKYGVAIDDVTAAQGDDFNDALVRAKTAFTGVALTIGTNLLPKLTPLVNKFADLTSNVIAFMDKHPTLIANLTVAATAFGVIATAIGGLLIGSLALPTLITAFSGLGAILSVAGPVGIALTGAAVLIYNLYKNWDVVCAGFKALYDTMLKPVLTSIKTAFTAIWTEVKQDFTWIYNKVKTVIMDIWTVLTPLIDGFINGFDSVWSVVETVFTAVYNFVAGEKGIIGKMYEAFRWFLDKLGIELPEASELFGDIKLAGEGAADGVKSKWNEMKASFARNMAENKASHTAEIEVMKANEESYTAKVVAEEDTRLEEKMFDNTLWGIHYKTTVEDMAADENAIMDEQRKYEKEQLDIQAVDIKSNWEQMWTDVYTNFNERLGDMGNAWMKAFSEGNFKNGIDFAKSYLVSAFEAGFMDIGGRVMQEFIGKIKGAVTDMASGLGGALSGVLGTVAGFGAGAVAGIVVNELAGAFTPDYEKQRKERERKKAATTQFYTTEGIEKELQGSEWQYSRESLYRLRDEIKAMQDIEALDQSKSSTLRKIQELGYMNREEMIRNKEHKAEQFKIMEASAAAGYGYSYLAKALQDDPNFIKSFYGGSVNFATLMEIGRKTPEFQNNIPTRFHAGGIIQGVLGQEKVIRALAGEEVITRKDPRHSLNFGGGINVNITGNNINSELDMIKLAKRAGEEIMKSLKLQVQYAR